MDARRFYLGIGVFTAWLADVDAPLFVSHRQLRGRRRLPSRGGRPWALDSGAFTELSETGRFATSPAAYVDAARRYASQIGPPDFVAPQDHMCDPATLAGSSLAGRVEDAQRLTVESVLTLRALAPDLPIAPVLQGWTGADYHRCAAMYSAAGVDLEAEPVVGLGSIALRSGSGEVAAIIASFDGVRLHGFGVKNVGIARYGWLLHSADSMAWSYAGRRVRPCPLRPVVSCGNCRHFALEWRAALLPRLASRAPVQRAFDLS